MIFRYAPALFLTIFLTQAARASTFIAQCDATFGFDKIQYWSALLNSKDGQSTNHIHRINSIDFEITLQPGGAAFADAIILKVSSQKSEFEVISLLSNDGYGSIIYRGMMDGRKLTTECIVSRKQD